ncbi:hypothetical protein QYM36_013333 [Artemia franciscana]|uniref:Centromere/kinetochore protein zw10 homolog n=1 Tax=Artemia franciscana TaxID=6661 RepID=A0AA88HRI2_ARTSF|nr:hypothetical protein QYM36_013333 [Artemia franciscana]
MPIFKENIFSSATFKEEEDDSPILHLSKQLEENKRDLLEYLDSSYDKLIPAFETASQLSARISNLMLQVEEVTSTVENELLEEISSASTKKKALENDLNVLKREADVIRPLLRIDSMLNQIESLNQKDLKDLKCKADLISEAESLLESLSVHQELEILPVLEVEISKLKSQLLANLDHQWQERVSWQIYEAGDLELTCHKPESLHFLASILEEMGDYKLLVHQLSRSLFECILKIYPAKSCEILVKKIGETMVLRICKIKESVAAVEEVARNIIFVLTSLKEIFGHSTVQIIGDAWKKRISDFLIEKYIAPAIPSSANDLEAFESFISKVVSLEYLFKEAGFFGEEDSSLSNYVKNINFLYANKLCQEVLSSARNLILKDLSKTVRLGLEDIGMIESTYQARAPEEMSRLAEIGIDANKSPFVFPECVVSESVIELLALMKRTLSEAEQNGEDIQARLHHACRSIIDLYMSVLPTAHRNALENIPRHSALAYNNCMYLGHVLLTLEVLTVNSSKLFFVLDAQNLRQLGANLFLEQMKLQRTYLTNIIKEADFESQTVTVPTVEDSFQRCLLRLKFLQDAWQKVLPTTVYYKAIGILTNAMLEDIIGRTMAIEDISYDTAILLAAQGSFLLDSLPTLFSTAVVSRII